MRNKINPIKQRTQQTYVQVIDLFCGCGGMSYGFQKAKTKNVKYKVMGALDIDRHACATFSRMLGVKAVEKDICELRNLGKLRSVIKHWNLSEEHPLVLIGCAPCQGFSSHRKKDKRSDTRNNLLGVFSEICLKLQPDIIIMENVPEMLREKYWKYFRLWRERLQKTGYTVRTCIYNLASFGVPQERFRVLAIAARDWKKFEMPQIILHPSDYVTFRKAISHLPKIEPSQLSESDPMHVTSRHRSTTIDLIKQIPQDGGSRKSLPESIGPLCLTRVDGFRDVYGRLWWDKPAVAITARCRTPSCGRYIHPEQNRGLSIREAALLQGFPAEFYFDGPFDDKYKQIGNAVSPIFAQCIAEHLDKEWLMNHDENRVVNYENEITKPFKKSFSSAIAGIKRKMREAKAEQLSSMLYD